MLDTQTYIFGFRYLALTFVIGYFVLVLFGKSLHNKVFSRKTLYVVLAVLFGFYVLFKSQQFQVHRSLQTLVSIVDYNKTVDERLSTCDRPDSVIYELTRQLDSLEALKDKNNLINKVVGRSVSTDTLITQMQRYLNSQLFRARNINTKSYERFALSDYVSATSDIRSIKPEGLNSAYISAGVTIDEISTFRKNNTLLVRIVQVEKDSILYEQSYVPHSGINAFVLPNYFSSDKVELQLGYVSKQEPEIYHYIVEKPYER